MEHPISLMSSVNRQLTMRCGSAREHQKHSHSNVKQVTEEAEQ